MPLSALAVAYETGPDRAGGRPGLRPQTLDTPAGGAVDSPQPAYSHHRWAGQFTESRNATASASIVAESAMSRHG